jgi:hypothetical protein
MPVGGRHRGKTGNAYPRYALILMQFRPEFFAS